MSIYRCHVRDIIWKFAKFLSVRNKACDKRFPYIAASLFPSSPTGSGFAQDVWIRRGRVPPFVCAALADASAGGGARWRHGKPSANIGHFVERMK